MSAAPSLGYPFVVTPSDGNNLTVGAPIEIAASTVDDRQLARVELLLDRAVIAGLHESPFRLTVMVPRVGSGATSLLQSG